MEKIFFTIFPMSIGKIHCGLFALLFLSAALSEAPAQVGALRGRVADDLGQPLAGANVLLRELETGAATDAGGEFRISAVPPGEYTVIVTFIGFEPFQQRVVVPAAGTAELVVAMRPAVIEMRAITLVAEHLKGQAEALNRQMTADNISRIVSDEQLSRFSDRNIGDAVKRMSAVTVNYDQGEARYVNIRGLEPRLNSVALNGERLPSPDAETRAVQLDMISSEMIQSVEVHKTLTPDMDGDAVGGTVNLVTRPALFLRRLSLSAAGGYDELTGRPMVNGSAVAARRFFAEKLGVSISAGVFDRRFGAHDSEGIWATDKKGAPYVSQWDVRRYDVRRLRRGFSADLDWRPDEQNRFFLDFIVNRRSDWETRFRLRRRLPPPNKDGIAEGAEILRQTKGGLGGVVGDNARLEEQHLTAFRLKGKHDLVNRFTVEWTLSHNRVSEERPHERYLQWWVKSSDVAVDLSDPRTPAFSDAPPDSLFRFEELTEEFRRVLERDTRFALDVRLPLISRGRFKNELQFGGKIKSLRKSSDIHADRITLTPEGKMLWRNMLSTPVADYSPARFRAGDYRLGQFTTPEYLGRLDFDDETLFKKKSLDAQYGPQNYGADETVSSAYGMIRQRFGKTLNLIAGLRLERTAVTYNSFESSEDSDTLRATTGASNYVSFLPSLNLRWEPIERGVMRFAYSRNVARPDFYDLVPYRNLRRGGEVLRIGNPQLMPATSENWDLSGEYYDRSVGVASLGFFYKRIERFYYVLRENNVRDPLTSKKVAELYQPRNGGGADLFGIELEYQRQLTFLPGFLSNLTLYANLTRLFSSAEYPAFPGRIIPLPGAAKLSANLNLGYESKRFSAGLSFNHASAYLDPKEIDLTPGLERWYDRVNYLDFSASLRLTKQMRLFFEAKNLLDQPLRYYAGSPCRTYQQEYYGRRFLLGCNYDI